VEPCCAAAGLRRARRGCRAAEGERDELIGECRVVEASRIFGDRRQRRPRARRVDLADLTDARRFARELAAGPPLHGIVCNAGVQHATDTRRTADGYEETFAVNHLAHLAIVALAFPALAAGGRVVFVGSGTHDPRDRGAARFSFRGGRYTDARALADGRGDDAASPRQRNRDRYATSKLCNLLATHELARRIPAERACVLAIDPGLMPGTGLAREGGVLVRLGWHTVLRAAALAMPGASTARRSAAALAWALSTPELAAASGAYVDFRRRRIEPWEGAQRADWADDLYRTSLSLAGITNADLAPELRV
jgi:NAD(P)-dependent dehydrogenase (short-subunit alcohol dehydrogenase family)